MRVCFVNPPIFPYRKIMRNFDCATESKGNYLYQPYDFLLMSAKIPENWDLFFLDGVATIDDEVSIVEKISQFEPMVIVCAIAATNKAQDLNFLQKLRTHFNQAYLFVFGDLFIDDIAAKEVNSFVDGIFTSPVMFDFEELKKYDSRLTFESRKYMGFRNDEFYLKPDLKTPVSFTLKNVRHDLFLNSAYRWPFSTRFKYTTIFTAWGCPYSCSYCILNKFPNYWRDYKEILDEMRRIKELGIKEIYIGDRSFGLPLKNVMNLLQSMIDENFNFSWSTYFHPNQYTPELLELMKKSGCHTIIVGVESKDLKSLKKFGRHVRVEQFSELITHSKKIGMQICGDFIIGLPGEDKENIKQTIQFSRDLDLDYASYNIAAPLAGSSIRKMAIDIGAILPNEGEIDSLGKNKVVSVSNITGKELVSYRNGAIFKFYMRPSYLLKRLKKIKTFEHFIIQAMEAVLLIKKSF